jgi:hypothetical protein
MLEQQYDYYRSTNNKIIFYALGIVVAFAITLVVQHADGKHVLEDDWYKRCDNIAKVIMYVSVFAFFWIVYFLAVRKMDCEMRLIREYLIQTTKLAAEEAALLERNTMWKLRIVVFVLGCCLVLAVFIDTKPRATATTVSSTLICRTP